MVRSKNSNSFHEIALEEKLDKAEGVSSIMRITTDESEEKQENFKNLFAEN